MKAKTWKAAGLVMALMGALTVVNAEKGQQGDNDGPKKEGKKGQDGRPSREEMRQKYDADGDGQLSETERAALRADMEKRQGKPAGKRPSREEKMKKYDTDGNGELSKEERAAMREASEARRAESEQQGE